MIRALTSKYGRPYFRFMARPSNRDKILFEGLRLVHERGFGAASVRDIVRAAGVPQGSFTNHFASKEAFGLEILELYFSGSRHTIAQTLTNDAKRPLWRLREYIDANRQHVQHEQMRNGCLFGNFSIEVTDQSEAIRQRLVEIFTEVQGAVAYCLQAAIDDGEIGADVDPQAMAGLIVSSLQGAILLAKAHRSVAPVDQFEELLFSRILR